MAETRELTRAQTVRKSRQRSFGRNGPQMKMDISGSEKGCVFLAGVQCLQTPVCAGSKRSLSDGGWSSYCFAWVHYGLVNSSVA